MALENLNKQEFAIQVQQELDDLTPDQAKDDVKFQNTDEILSDVKDLTDTFEINKKIFVWKNFIAVKNVFQNVCWKNFDQIKMEDIFRLSDAKKSQLAREITALKIPDFDLKLPWKDGKSVNINAKYFYDFFQNGITLTEENLKAYIRSKKLELGTSTDKNDNKISKIIWEIDIDNNSNLIYILWQMQSNIREKSKREYKKMFKWDVPPMQKVYSFATWDLSGTTAIGWEQNTGRWYFKYDLKEKNQMVSNLRFWSKKWPAEIWISAVWTNGELWWWYVYISLGKNETIKLDYSANWLNLIGKLPDWVQWKDWILTIPNRSPYKDNPMEIKTESKEFSTGGYDDILFNFTCKNIGIWIATPMFDEGISKNLWLWEYKTDINEKNRILWGISAITDDISMAFADNIPINIWVSVDKNKFDESKISDFMKNTENVGLNSVMYNVTNQNEQAKIREKLTQAFNNISKQIESSNFEWDEIGKDAEKRLAKCRFWEVMDIALKDKNFRSQLASWKIKINPNFYIGDRWNRNISVSCNEEDMILHITK